MADPCDNSVLHLHSRCHPALPFVAVRVGGTVRLRCLHPDCRKDVAALPAPEGDRGWKDLGEPAPGVRLAVLAQPCHPEDPVTARLLPAEGVVLVCCHECGAVVLRCAWPGSGEEVCGG